MSAVSITATLVVPGSDANTATGIAGASITAGQALYLDSSTNTLKLAQCDGTTAEATGVGIALNGGSSGQVITYVKGGTVTIGGTIVAGTPYCIGTGAGDIVPFADLASTNKVSFLGWGSTTAILTLGINNTGVTKA